MIFEKAAATLPSTRRPRKRGDGMMEPVAVLEFRNPATGLVEQLRPGRDRVSYDWWGYRKNPELFRVVNRDDDVTVARHRGTLARTQRQIERQLGRRTGTTRATTQAPKRFTLSGGYREEKWKLP